MEKLRANFRLSRVQGNREIVSWFNVWERAYRAYRMASMHGFDYVELVRVRDGVVLYHDGSKPSWMDYRQAHRG